MPQKLTLNGIVYGLLDVADEFQGTILQIKLNMGKFICGNLTRHHKKISRAGPENQGAHHLQSQS